ncbi:hypothetical protein BDP27DRAFT_1405559 [Rhodocollybia butyracea]|uniref:Uncharacterized protein n=1 Tax=Rhodocollybia butyracea TaxID=206335 RepID=A0A9P5PEU1_9AGAR|nr:hypothetical protein BDP27DRAFT_1405559 [Rhodocollybia butyracea]
MAPIQILLTLLWVSASFLATASLPTDASADDLAGMTRIVGNRRALRCFFRCPLGKKVTPNSAAQATHLIEVPLHLWISKEGTDDEHWSLVINSKEIFHAINFRSTPSLPYPTNPGFLVVENIPFTGSTQTPGRNLIDLGKAKFKTEEEMTAAFSQLAKIGMPHKAHVVGGNCMDYVKMALEKLVEKDHILNIPPIFRNIYDERYTKVRQRIYEDNE